MQQVVRWHIYPTVDELENYASRAMVRAAVQAVQTNGRFTVVLAGGSTPEGIYRRLAQMPGDWSQWQVYFGDERCVTAEDAQRNDRMARTIWLDRVPIPASQIHSIPAELGCDIATRRYREVIRDIDTFDFVLLGLGEDGHTASLFPGKPMNDVDDVIAIEGAPKPPPQRVSLSATRLSRARQVMFVVAGEKKREAVRAWRGGDPIPARSIVPVMGVDTLLDVTAWPDTLV